MSAVPRSLSDIPWSVGVRLAREEIAGGTTAKREEQLRLIYGDDLLTGQERSDQGWYRSLHRLRAYVASHGCLPAVGDDRPLYSWITKQRQAWREDLLTPYRRELLESIDLWEWDPREAAFQRNAALFDRYTGLTGAAPRHGVVVDGVDIPEWVTKQRQKYARGVMSDSRRVTLERLDWWSWSMSESRVVTAICKIEGRLRLGESLSDVLASDLGPAVVALSKDQTLPARLIARLLRIPGWRWDPAAVHPGLPQRLHAWVTHHHPEVTLPPGALLHGVEIVPPLEEHPLGIKMLRTRFRRGLPMPDADPLQIVADCSAASLSAELLAQLALCLCTAPEEDLPNEPFASVEKVGGFLLTERERWASYIPHPAWAPPFRLLFGAPTSKLIGWNTPMVPPVAVPSAEKSTGPAVGVHYQTAIDAIYQYYLEHRRLPRIPELAGSQPVGLWVWQLRRLARDGELAALYAWQCESIPGW